MLLVSGNYKLLPVAEHVNFCDGMLEVTAFDLPLAHPVHPHIQTDLCLQDDPKLLSLMLFTTRKILSPAMTIATSTPRTFKPILFVNVHIFALVLVNCTKGTTEKVKVSDNMTCERTSSFPTAASPKTAATMTAGVMAMRRVMSLRDHGGILKFRKPSITICPLRVPGQEFNLNDGPHS